MQRQAPRLRLQRRDPGDGFALVGSVVDLEALAGCLDDLVSAGGEGRLMRSGQFGPMEWGLPTNDGQWCALLVRGDEVGRDLIRQVLQLLLHEGDEPCLLRGGGRFL